MTCIMIDENENLWTRGLSGELIKLNHLDVLRRRSRGEDIYFKKLDHGLDTAQISQHPVGSPPKLQATQR